MFTKKMFMLVLYACILSCAISFFTIFYVTSRSEISKKSAEAAENGAASLIDMDAGAQRAADTTDDASENAFDSVNEYIMVSNEDRILVNTRIVYQYYYTGDNVMEEHTDIPPDYIIGMKFSDLMNYYPNWQIISFSGKQVVMRKIINDTSDRHYIVSQQDGYIAVFYESGEENGSALHEMTDISIDTLTHEEQVRLNDGIYVRGDEELYRILEDYGS